MTNLLCKDSQKGRAELHQKFKGTFPLIPDSKGNFKKLTLVMGIHRVLLEFHASQISNFDAQLDIGTDT